HRAQCGYSHRPDRDARWPRSWPTGDPMGTHATRSNRRRRRCHTWCVLEFTSVGRSSLSSTGPIQVGLASLTDSMAASYTLSVGQGDGQWLWPGAGQRAAARGGSVDDAAQETDQESSDPEEDTARAEGDVKCHVFGPFAGWRVMEAIKSAGSWPARTG